MAEKMTLATATPDGRKFFKTAPAPASYAAIAEIATRLDGMDGTIRVSEGGVANTSYGRFAFWLTGGSGKTGNGQVFGWRFSETGSLVPFLLFDVGLIAGTGQRTDATQFWVNTITITSAVPEAAVLAGPSNCPIAYIECDLRGAVFLSLNPGSGNATTINGMYLGI